MKRTTIFLFALSINLLFISCGLKPIPTEIPLVLLDKKSISLSKLGNGTTLIFNDANILHPSDLTSRLNIQVDGKNLGQLGASNFVVIKLEIGSHLFTLKHWDIVTMSSEHEINVTDSLKILKVKPTITSNDLEIVDQLPDNWEIYSYMEPEPAGANELPEIKNRFQIALHGGLGYRIGRVAEDYQPFIEDYIRNMKLGSSLGLDVSYFLQPKWGFGLKYSRYSSSGVLNDIVFTLDDGSETYGQLGEDIFINFIGLSYVHTFSFNNLNHSIYTGISQGYMNYRNTAVLINRKYELKGATYGLGIDLGYNYAISKHFSLGAQTAFLGGVLKNLNQDEAGTQTSGEVKENLSRIDLTAGVRFRM